VDAERGAVEAMAAAADCVVIIIIDGYQRRGLGAAIDSRTRTRKVSWVAA
jgi:hypothetical protein